MAKPDQGLIAYESLNGKDCTALQLWKIRLTLAITWPQGLLGEEYSVTAAAQVDGDVS